MKTKFEISPDEIAEAVAIWVAKKQNRDLQEENVQVNITTLRGRIEKAIVSFSPRDIPVNPTPDDSIRLIVEKI